MVPLARDDDSLDSGSEGSLNSDDLMMDFDDVDQSVDRCVGVRMSPSCARELCVRVLCVCVLMLA